MKKLKKAKFVVFVDKVSLCCVILHLSHLLFKSWFEKYVHSRDEIINGRCYEARAHCI